MAEIQKIDLTFVDETGTDFNKFGITEEGGVEKQVTLRRLANITQSGTPFNASNMNKIPNKINEVIDELNKIPDTYETQKHASDTYETKTDAQKKLEEAKEYTNQITDKLEVEIECNHEYEITGVTNHEYNLAIPEESSMEITRIEGQTARFSENLGAVRGTSFTLDGVTYTVNSSEGSITLNGTATNTVDSYLNDIFRAYLVSGRPYTTRIYTSQTDADVVLLDNWTADVNYRIDSQFVTNITPTVTEEFQFRVVQRAGVSYNNLKIYPMIVAGTYTNETMPTFKLKDNTLVNAKCDFVSTNVNLFDYANSNYTDGVDINSNFALNGNKSATKNYTQVIPNTQFNIEITGGEFDSFQIYEYDIDKKLITSTDYASRNFYFTTNTNCYYLRLSQYKNGTSIKPTQIMLNYGTEAKTYVPHEKDTLIFSQEMGKYDYWENGVLYKQTSDEVVLDGSDDENWIKVTTSSTERWRFQVEGFLPLPSNDISSLYNVKSTWVDGTSDNTWGNVRCISVNGDDVYICNPDLQSVEELKSWLQSNPITLRYKLATPTITQLPLNNFMKVWNSGLQQQKIEGKYLPYNVTKKYAISLKSQVDNNATENYKQDLRIRQNASEIEALKSDLENKEVNANKVYIPSEEIYLDEKLKNIDSDIYKLKTQHITDDNVFIVNERIYLSEKLMNIDEKISFIANNITSKATKSASAMSGTIISIDGTYPTTITANILKYLTITPTATKGANVSEVAQVQYDSQTGICTINVEATNPSRLTAITIEYTYTMEILWKNRDNLIVLAEE